MKLVAVYYVTTLFSTETKKKKKKNVKVTTLRHEHTDAVRLNYPDPKFKN